ncbi:MAG: efflux RND transporter periplasmic adaptor subunit [Syntrophobacteraceae bacterium]|jgi:multidrug resistance efflux pump
MKKKGLLVCLVLASFIGVLSLWKQPDENKASTVDVERYVSAEGKVEIRPGFEVEIGSEFEGRIADFPVKEGDWVNRGDTIAVMANKDICARLAEAEAGLAVEQARLREILSGARMEEIKSAAAVLEAARADLEFERACLARYRALYEKGAISKQSLDEKENHEKNARAKVTKAAEEKVVLEKGPKSETITLQENVVAQAKASVELQRSLFEKSRVTAPIAGKIIRKYLDRGESATKERALAVIADISQIWVNAEVDESDIGALQVGDPVEVRADAFAGKSFPGKVEEIADYAGPRKVRPNDQTKNLDMKVVQAKIGLLEPTSLKPNMTVEIKIKQR